MCEQDTFLDTIGMLSVARAAEGGTSYFSSILAAYDDLADHQDVAPLFTGWPLYVDATKVKVYTEHYHVGGGYETRPIGGGAHVTADPVPVLSWAGEGTGEGLPASARAMAAGRRGASGGGAGECRVR